MEKPTVNAKPTEEEYINAKSNVDFLRNNITHSHERIMNLVEELSKEKRAYDDYQKLLEQNKHIVLLYEVWEKVEKEGEKK